MFVLTFFWLFKFKYLSDCKSMSMIWPVLTQVIWNNFCRELEVEKKNMNEEINMLEQQLQDEQEASDDKTKRMSKLEKDIRDLRVQLEQKIEIGLWNKFSLEWFDLVCNTQGKYDFTWKTVCLDTLYIEIRQENVRVNMIQPYLSIFVQLFSTYFLSLGQSMIMKTKFKRKHKTWTSKCNWSVTLTVRLKGYR